MKALTALMAFSVSLSAQRKTGNPLEHLPENIEILTYFGERADISPDNQRIAFMSKSFGDAFVIDLKTRSIRCLTCNVPAAAFLRVMHLITGDYILIGPEHFEDIRISRARDNELWFLSKQPGSKPVRLNQKMSEGAAISKKSMKISFSQVPVPDPTLKPEESRLMTAEVDLAGGTPRLVNQKTVYESKSAACRVEAQDFYDNDSKMTFTCYEPKGLASAMSIDLATGAVTNMSKAPGSYNECEGILPDGRYTLVEADRQGSCDPHGWTRRHGRSCKSGSNGSFLFRATADFERCERRSSPLALAVDALRATSFFHATLPLLYSLNVTHQSLENIEAAHKTQLEILEIKRRWMAVIIDVNRSYNASHPDAHAYDPGRAADAADAYASELLEWAAGQKILTTDWAVPIAWIRDLAEVERQIRELSSEPGQLSGAEAWYRQKIEAQSASQAITTLPYRVRTCQGLLTLGNEVKTRLSNNCKVISGRRPPWKASCRSALRKPQPARRASSTPNWFLSSGCNTDCKINAYHRRVGQTTEND